MKPKNVSVLWWMIMAVCSVGILLLTSCKTTPMPSAKKAVTVEASSAIVLKSGVQLWSENCMVCHNLRSPSSYNDVNWDVTVHHMRVRANLTAEQHKQILEFLKAGN